MNSHQVHNFVQVMLEKFYISGAPVTLKQEQSHQNWYEQVQLNRGYNHAKINIPCVNMSEKNAMFLCCEGNNNHTKSELDQVRIYQVIQFLNNLNSLMLLWP